MTEKSRIQYLGNSGEKWIAVRIPVSGAAGDTRHYEFRASKVDGLLEISENRSALLLDNDKQIPVNLPLQELRRRFHGRGNAANQLDLTDVTGIEEAQESDLKAAFTATLPARKDSNQNIPENPDLKITFFAHHRLDENPTAKYCPVTVLWSNISRTNASVSAKNTTCITLHQPVDVAGAPERTRWWLDMDANIFMAAINDAMINGTSHLDLREETRKRAPPQIVSRPRR
jgi:hypothetical protein